MAIRSKWLPAIVLCLAAGAGATLLWRHQSQPNPNLTTGAFIEPRSRLPDFSLIDDHGRPFTGANLLGHWSMLYFGYTNCPDVCPATLSTLAAMEKKLRAAASPVRPQVLFVTADPARDTPAQLARYVPYFDPEFVGVMPVRQDIEVLPADEPKRLSLGWVVSEIIGLAIVNPRGVACGRKSVIVGA